MGFGVISQIYTLINLVTSTAHLGAPVGLTPILSKQNNIDAFESKRMIYSYFKHFTRLYLGVTCGLTVLIIVFSSEIAGLVLGVSNYSRILIVMALSIPFVVNYSIIESFLRSFEQINTIVKIGVFSGISCLLLLFPLLFYGGMKGASIYLFLVGLVPFLFFKFRYENSLKRWFAGPTFAIGRKDKAKIYKVGLSSLIAFFLFQSVILLLRKFIISNFGLESNGLYQSVLGISLNYFVLIYVFLTNRSLPQLSKCATDDETISALNRDTRFLALVIVPMILLLFCYRSMVISLLYSSSFEGAKRLVPFQLIGDGLRVFAALFSLWLLPRGRILVLVSIDVVFNLSLLALPHILVGIWGHHLEVIPIAYSSSFIIQFALYFLYTRRTLGFKFTGQTRKTLLLSISTVAVSATFSYLYEYTGYFAIWGFLLIWFFLVFSRAERDLSKDIFRKFLLKYLTVKP